ncbi:hypothetical protein [Hymenobacter rigui]|uniref:hypothetical protein n=1 Tax=Hymenobacter rigui TaxID=334424 RepID=UPI0011CF825C|nr:hypothetical protein [Hymenobacter rigui]
MRYFFSCLLVATVLLISCRKKAPEPVYSLQGQWTLQRIETTEYGPDDNPIGPSATRVPSPAERYTITPTTLEILINTPTPFTFVYSYIRTGDVLSFKLINPQGGIPDFESTIKKLTATEMVLSTRVYVGNSYLLHSNHYVRQ